MSPTIAVSENTSSTGRFQFALFCPDRLPNRIARIAIDIVPPKK